MTTTHDRKKNYANTKWTRKEFQVGDDVFLKVKQKRNSLRAKTHTKLAPRFVGPFEILARVGPVEYKLDLPPHIRIHDVFHVSLLKKNVSDKTHFIDWNVL